MAEGGIPELGDAADDLVISGVIDGVKQSFIDSGVSLDVLEKLEQLWISKLKSNPNAGLSLRDITHPPASSSSLSTKKRGTKKRSVPLSFSVKSEEINDELEDESGHSAVVDDGVIVISSDEHNELSETDKPKTSKLKLKLKKNIIPQVDGPGDSSDEDGVDDDDDDDGDDDDDDDDDDNDPDGDDDEGVEEEPLGSEDDISDEDASDLFDTENVVVCQYDKITRARNKWKFHLKVEIKIFSAN